MKKHLINSIALALILLLFCGSTVCAESFSDTFSTVKDYDATLNPTTNDCMIQPQAKAIETYAVDEQILLPCLNKSGEVLTLGFLMKGAGNLSHPVNMRIYTDTMEYTFVPSAANTQKQNMITINLGNKTYNMCMLSSAAFHVLSDIAASASVAVSYCDNSSFANASMFALNQDTLNAFKAVNKVYQRYYSVGESGTNMFAGMDFLADMLVSFSETNKRNGMWDDTLHTSAQSADYNASSKKSDLDNASSQLRKLKEMLNEGLITQEDYDAKKSQLLGL